MTFLAATMLVLPKQQLLTSDFFANLDRQVMEKLVSLRLTFQGVGGREDLPGDSREATPAMGFCLMTRQMASPTGNAVVSKSPAS